MSAGKIAGEERETPREDESANAAAAAHGVAAGLLAAPDGAGRALLVEALRGQLRHTAVVAAAGC